MWQRIQTLYLVFAVILLGLMFAFPVSKFSGNDFSGQLYVYGMKAVNGELPITLGGLWIISLAVVISAVVIFISIFRYRQRMNQLRMIMLAMLFNILLIGLLFYFNDRIENFESVFGHVTYKQASFFPLLSLLCLLMAGRALRKDEARIRAANRLR